MDGARAWLARTRTRYVRARWRRAGAWLWPAFVALTVADGVIGHLLPPQGAAESLFAAALLGLLANLLGVILLSRPLGNLLRRFRRDMPGIVARDYGGTVVVLCITGVLAVVGLIHRPAIDDSRRATADAIARAQAWIGDRAPDQFRRNLEYVSLFVIQSGTIYRACVPSTDHTRNYCVVVNRALPFERSVTFSGYEPNSVLSTGTG